MTCSRLLIPSPMKVTIVHLQSVLAMQIEYPPSAEIRSDVTALLELLHCLLDQSRREGGAGVQASSMGSNRIVIMARYILPTFCKVTQLKHLRVEASNRQTGD